MLPTGLHTEVVFSAAVESPPTTPSLPSVLMLQATGRSRTLGEPAGENQVTSDLLLVTPATFLVNPTLLHEI